MEPKRQTLKYYVLDVFASESFQGNPLAVIITEDELTKIEYQNIANEFGYSETSFISYSESENILKVRSFTPSGFEINGAGHNLLGAVSLVMLTNKDLFPIRNHKPVVVMKDRPIDFVIYGNTVEMMQQPAILGAAIPPNIIAKVISLSKDDVVYGNLSPTVVSTEVSHLMVPMKNLEALHKARPRKKGLDNLSKEFGFQGVYCFSLSKKDKPHLVETRFFNPGIGIDEDPATGSAAGPMAGFLYHHRIIDKAKEYQLLLGKKIGRPSILKFKVAENGIVISGSSAITMEGRIYLNRFRS